MAIEPARGCGWLVKLMTGAIGKAQAQALGNLDAETARRRSASDDA